MRRPRHQRLDLLSRFALISAVLITALGVVVGATLQHSLRERAVTDAIRTGEVAANLGVKPLFRPSDLRQDFVPLDPERVAELDAVLLGGLSDDGVVRIKVWNRRHWIVWSDNPGLRGRWFPSTELLDLTFEGEVTSEVTDLTAPEEREERDFGTLLAVYVPLTVDADGRFTNAPGATGEVIGAFEIYLPYEPIAATIRADTVRLYATLAAGLLLLYFALYRLVAGASRRLRRQAEENLHQALHDGLTGLANRTLLHQRLDEAITARGPDQSSALLLFDVDGFKVVNETLGHGVGDQVLGHVARTLRGCLEDSETVARFGGDEFAVVVRVIADERDAVARAEQILAAFRAPATIGEITMQVALTCGIATAPAHGVDASLVVQRADVALNVAKAAHVNVEVYRPENDDRSADRLQLAGEIRRAIDEKELVLLYQPKLDLGTGRVTGVEALVRWNHPTRGMLSPFAFISVVETTDLINDLTDLVLSEAIAQCRRWHDQGLDLEVAVNLSARNVNDDELPGRIGRLLAEHQVPPRLLECELTETAVLDQPDRAARVLGRLHDLGVRIAIDDFGTGYASLAYLTSLPIDVLKIDRSFVSELTHGGAGAAIVEFTMSLAEALGLHVVGEGVEDLDTLMALRDVRCQYAQGFLISRPIPPDELFALASTFDPRAMWPMQVAAPSALEETRS